MYFITDGEGRGSWIQNFSPRPRRGPDSVEDRLGDLLLCCRCGSLKSWYVEFVILRSYYFFVMFANITFTLSYFVRSLFAMKPNVFLMVLLLVDMED